MKRSWTVDFCLCSAPAFVLLAIKVVSKREYSVPMRPVKGRSPQAPAGQVVIRSLSLISLVMHSSEAPLVLLKYNVLRRQLAIRVPLLPRTRTSKKLPKLASMAKLRKTVAETYSGTCRKSRGCLQSTKRGCRCGMSRKMNKFWL